MNTSVVGALDLLPLLKNPVLNRHKMNLFPRLKFLIRMKKDLEKLIKHYVVVIVPKFDNILMKNHKINRLISKPAATPWKSHFSTD